MNITKYPQSSLLLEKNGQRILIDPGSFMAAKFSVGDLPEIEAILLTHRHADHADPDLIKSISAKKVIPVHYSIFSDEKPEGAVGLVKYGAPDVEMITLSNSQSVSL